MSKDCPVSASLTADDKAKLLRIKQDAEQNFPPPKASMEVKRNLQPAPGDDDAMAFKHAIVEGRP
jgi:hypothetical protein